jgi:hypothetical protein
MKASYFSEQFASALPYGRYLQTGTQEQQRRWTQVYEIARLADHQQHLLGGFVRGDEDPDLQQDLVRRLRPTGSAHAKHRGGQHGENRSALYRASDKQRTD